MHSRCFRSSECFAPTAYASLDLVERAFSQLLFCRTLSIKTLGVKGVDHRWAYDDNAAPFVSLPCVQNSEVLRVTDAWSKIRGPMFDWLNSGGAKKKLAVESNFTYLVLAGLSHGLFEVSST